MVNILKFRTIYLSVKIFIKAEIHEMLVRIANREDWVCAVCHSVFVRQQLLEILEYLL